MEVLPAPTVKDVCVVILLHTHVSSCSYTLVCVFCASVCVMQGRVRMCNFFARSSFGRFWKCTPPALLGVSVYFVMSSVLD